MADYDEMTKTPYPTRVQPLAVAATIFLTALILIALGSASDFGVTQATYEASGTKFTKDVGFLHAVNWSWNFAVIVPAVAFFLLSAARSSIRLPEILCRKGMLVSTDGFCPIPIDGEAECSPQIQKERSELSIKWNRLLRRSGNWAIIATVLAIFVNYGEWYGTSASPLWANNLNAAPELDWGVGALIDDNGNANTAAEPLSRLANASFSFVAFTMQFAVSVILVWFIGHLMLIALFVRDLGSGNEGVRIIPRVSSQDRRRGFELFGVFAEQVVLGFAMAYVMFSLSRLWNVYLRSDAQTFGSFFVEDMIIGFRAALGSTGAVVESVGVGISHSTIPIDYSSLMVGIGTLVVMFTCAMFTIITLRQAAQEGRNSTLEYLTIGEGPLLFTELSRQAARESLQSMATWPLQWPPLNVFLLAIVIGAACMIFYALIPLAVGLLVGRAAYGAWKLISNEADEEEVP